VRAQILYESTTELVQATFSRRPSSCVVDVYDHGGTPLVTDAAATLGPATTVSDSSGYGQSNPRLINLTSVESLAFLGRYLAINASGQREAVQLRSVPTSGACETLETLEFAYEAGDDFEEPAARYELGSTITDDVGLNFRARFTATMPDGSVETKDIFFDVVYHRLEQPITEQTVDLYCPGILDLLPSALRGTRWRDLLGAAWDEVYQDLVTEGLIPSRYLDDQRMVGLHKQKFKLMLAEEGMRFGQEEYPLQTAKYFKGAYVEKLADCVRVAGWYDHSNDMKPDAGENRPAWRGLRL